MCLLDVLERLLLIKLLILTMTARRLEGVLCLQRKTQRILGTMLFQNYDKKDEIIFLFIPFNGQMALPRAAQTLY